jgi:hypothetical protein
MKRRMEAEEKQNIKGRRMGKEMFGRGERMKRRK